MMISLTYWVENIMGKEENVGYQDLLLFPQCFQKAYKKTLVRKVTNGDNQHFLLFLESLYPR